MYGDITRDTFPYAKLQRISGVRMQQGRVLLDADWNLAFAIFSDEMRVLARDLIGLHGGNGFLIGLTDPNSADFTIGTGSYYVDGIRCANEPLDPVNPVSTLYHNQPYFHLEPDQEIPTGTHLAYLDAWERQVQDDYFREKALNGVETTKLVQLVWQVKALKATQPQEEDDFNLADFLAELISLRGQRQRDYAREQTLYEQLQDYLNVTLIRLSSARMRAQLEPSGIPEDPCILPPTAGYRGNENQLYRVEIHTGGDENSATFKWSRDNGSRASAWLGIVDGAFLVQNSRGFEDSHWVELTHDELELSGMPGILAKLTKVDGNRLVFDPVEGTLDFNPDYKNPLVRRWDQSENEQFDLRDGAIPVSAAIDEWVNLEYGVQIRFEPGKTYRTGEFWQIPARSDIEWTTQLRPDGKPEAVFQPPRGIVHSYAPLARITVDAGGNVTAVDDLRRIIIPIAR